MCQVSLESDSQGRLWQIECKHVFLIGANISRNKRTLGKWVIEEVLS